MQATLGVASIMMAARPCEKEVSNLNHIKKTAPRQRRGYMTSHCITLLTVATPTKWQLKNAENYSEK